jgi:hypothetical protein
MILSTTDFERSLSFDMDKITIIKMLLASQDENRQLQARLDKQDEEARLREDRLNKRIDELTRLNRHGL